jgi:hypothetical protein
MDSMKVSGYDSDIAPTRRRLEFNTYLVLAVMIVVSLIIGDPKFILGTVLGGGLGWLNHRWLSSSLSVIIPIATQTSRVPRWTAAKFILRYLVVGSAIGLALWSGRFNLFAIVLGFCAFVGALMIEAVYQVYIMIRYGEEITK